MSNPTIVITDPANLSITINGVRLPTHMTSEGVVSQIRNSQVRELGHTPLPSALYILFEGCELRQTRGGCETAWVQLPRMAAYGTGESDLITSYLTPIPPPPPKKQKPRAYTPRPFSRPRKRTGPPARRGPAWKFRDLFAACDALIAEDPNHPLTIRMADGLAKARQVSGQD